MDKAEYGLLCESIREHGFDEARPIILYEGKILDGRHRYEICLDLGVEPFFMETTLEGTDPFDYVWRMNAAQRNWASSEQKVLVGNAYRRDSAAWRTERERIKEEANKARSASAKRQNRDESGLFGNNEPKETTVQRVTGQCDPRPDKTKDAHPSRALIAQEERVSESAVKRAQTIYQKSPALAEKVAAGEMTANAALREIKRQETVAALDDINAKKAKELEGVYDVIVIDPPWPMQKLELDARPNQVGFDYPVMQEEELAAMKIPAADSCHLWLWTTQKFLPMAFRLLDKWGFKYVCAFVWHKPGGFQPIGLPQYNCEFALYARKGAPSFIDTKAFPVCFEAPRGRHSEKPEEFYEVIRRVTAGRRIDMFNRRPIEGFDRWGNEADGDE
jgi:N6-adenosine-specific RNA methylase IME4